MLVLDGAYTFAHDRARFHRASAPSNAELVRLLDTLIRRIDSQPESRRQSAKNCSVSTRGYLGGDKRNDNSEGIQPLEVTSVSSLTRTGPRRGRACRQGSRQAAISQQEVQAGYERGARHYDFVPQLYRLIGLRLETYRSRAD
jgi:hypothetical protein